MGNERIKCFAFGGNRIEDRRLGDQIYHTSIEVGSVRRGLRVASSQELGPVGVSAPDGIDRGNPPFLSDWSINSFKGQWLLK